MTHWDRYIMKPGLQRRQTARWSHYVQFVGHWTSHTANNGDDLEYPLGHENWHVYTPVVDWVSIKDGFKWIH